MWFKIDSSDTNGFITRFLNESVSCKFHVIFEMFSCLVDAYWENDIGVCFELRSTSPYIKYMSAIS